MFSIFIFSIVIVGSIFLASLVYHQNPKGRDNKNFVLAIFWLILWLVANYFENEPFTSWTRTLFLFADFIIAPIMGYFWFSFCFHFQEENQLSIAKKLFLSFSSLLLIVVILKGLVINNIDVSGPVIKFDFGPLFIVYAVLILFYLIGGPSMLVLKFKRLKGQRRMQTLYALTGFLLTALVGAIINLFFQEKVTLGIFRLGTYGVIFLIGFTSYAIIKHHLFDIRVIIQRGIIYSSILSLIVGFYVSLVFVLGFFFQQATDATIILAAGISTVLGIYGVPYLERFFRRATDKIFFKDKYDYSQAIYELSEILNQNIELNKLLKKIIYKIQEIFRTSFVAVILPDQNIILNTDQSMRQTSEFFTTKLIKTMEMRNQPILLADEIPEIANELLIKKADSADIKAIKQAYKNALKYGVEIYVPILLNRKLIGLIILTKKLSGDQYTPEDIKLLKTFSYQASVALDKAKLFQQVKEYSKELEEKVKKRTAKIQGLQEGQKEMMQEMAHGLQTPITILKGELSQLSKKLKESKEIVAIERSITRVSDFIYGMLRIAKLESEGRDFHKEEFNLSDLLNELIESYEIITNEKNIKIDHKITKHIKLFGNKKAIEEMITNLVSNGVKYVKEGGNKTINLSLKQDQGRIKLIVADNGIGIGKQDIPKLFQRFYRAESKDPARHKGTGLGLAICKGIAEKHNGSIKVESEVNKGAKFIITLPIAPIF